MVDRDFFQFVVFFMFHGYIPGCPLHIVVHEPVAFVEVPIQDEMNVGVHQTEGQDDNPIGLQGDKHTVHPVNEIIVTLKDGIDGISIGTEVPTVLDGDVLAFDERGVEPEIRNDLPEQFPSYLHLPIQRR